VVGKALVTVLKFCRQRGFRVKECHGDGEFESPRATLADAGSGLNVTGEDEHVPGVERHIRTKGASPELAQHCPVQEASRDDDC
jgi:hypothetical protein